MNAEVDKGYNERALEYELTSMGFSVEAATKMKARMEGSDWQRPFTILDEQGAGSDRVRLTIQVDQGDTSLLHVTAYDVFYRGLNHRFDEDDIYWPTVPQARNLLVGASVGRAIISPVDGIPVVEWFRLDMSFKKITGMDRLENLGFFDLQREIELLPIREQHYPGGPQAIYSALLDGNKPSVYYRHSREIEANLEVNAVRQCIEVRSKAGKVFADTIALAIADRVMGRGTQHLFNSNGKIMRNNNYIEENYEYNIGRLRQHGYPDTKDKELKEKMQQGDSRILLEFHSAEYAGNVRATVHIEKADSGAYFPNRYELELKRPDSQYARRQFFQIQNFKGHGRQYDIPWRMGVNLLRGGQVLNHWLKGDGSSIYEWRGLNFSQRTSAGHGYVSFEPQVFDVEKKLDELPILEKDKEDLRHSHVVRSIETGNSQVVHLGIPGNPTIRLRANVPKRDLDIINGGHVISITQFNADLEEMKNQDIQMKAPENETHTPEKETQRKVLPSINQESNQHSALLEAGEKMGNVLIVGASGNETSKMVDVTDQVKKILTGNPITPHPSNNPGNHVKHGM